MRKNFKKAIFSIFTVLLTLSMATTSFAAVVDYGSEYNNQPTKSYSVTFKDVSKSYWAFSYIGEMVERGVLNGYPNGYFYPENTITRGEFSKIMCLAASISVSPVYYTSYADVSTSDWFAPYVEAGKYYLSGYVSDGEKYYMPEANALREDIAVALVKLKGYDTSLADESMLKAMFTDYQSISSGARKYVAIAVENGLISGYEDNTFRGQSSITRSEAATLLWRAYQYGNNNKVFEKEEFEEPAKTPVIDDDDEEDEPKQTIKKDESKNNTKDDEDEKPSKTETKDPEPEDDEEYVEPEPVYTHEIKTIANGVTNLDMMIHTDDGIAYSDLDARRIYTVETNGKKAECVLDCKELPYLGDEELSKESLTKMHTGICAFGYNYYDSTLYAIIYQLNGANFRHYLYDITEDKVAKDITEIYNNGTPTNGTPLFFDNNGNIMVWDRKYSVIDVANMKILDKECFIYPNYSSAYVASQYGKKIRDLTTGNDSGIYIDYYIEGNIKAIGNGYNGCYFTETSNNEFYFVNYKGNEKYLFNIDDIDITDGKRFKIDTIDIGTNYYSETDCEKFRAYCTGDKDGNIYFWDSNYSCIRQISAK